MHVITLGAAGDASNNSVQGTTLPARNVDGTAHKLYGFRVSRAPTASMVMNVVCFNFSN